MSGQVSRNFLIRFMLILGFVTGCMFGSGVTGFILLQRESPEQAYERGFKDAHWFVKYDIEMNPTVVTDNLGRTWYGVDSTDTMPAEESLSTLDSIRGSLTVRTIYSIPPTDDSMDKVPMEVKDGK